MAVSEQRVRELMNSGLALGAALAIAESEATQDTAIANAGGAEQTVSLLGPYEMTFAQAGEGNYVPLVTIPAGTLLVRAFARVTADWDQPVTISIGIGSTLNPEDNHGLVTYTDKQFFNEFWGADYEEAPASTPKVGFAVTDADLVGAVDSPTATEGTVAIYALIATPA